MAFIVIESIRQSVNQGTLIDLAEDYRTSRSIRAHLPRQTSYPFAISTTAYNQEIQPGTARDRQSRLDAIGALLTKVLGLRENPTAKDLELRFPAETGQSPGAALKLAWYAPDKYWVMLLPQEQLQPALKLA